MTDDRSAGGTYTLLVELLETTTAEVGALGTLTFDPGWYAYTGSALGTGGFSRVQRHRELAAGERDTRHWHVDYLLSLPDASIDTVVTSSGVDIECSTAGALDGAPVPDFGCSDCGCDSHLHYASQRDCLLDSVRRAHQSGREAASD
ncbi:GIY-YIG nuclease family protein [Salinibaculum rarum]|uniref:GIY-YIG nuclease family protein n=1 Tax=Salinibaculum rarum TaxID=3058903 RepID=UPI00265F9C66|nr:GIY-YIG nuclease family protein [Salinibaculum sp. KK48]